MAENEEKKEMEEMNVKEEEKKKKEEKKEMKEKEDWRLVTIENLKKKFRQARRILFGLSLISMVVFLISCFTLPLRPVVLYFFPAFLVSFLAWYATRAFKIAKAWENLIFFWKDDHSRTEGPGWYWIWPPLGKVKFEDVREREVNIEPQEVITKDGITLNLDASAWYRIRDAASYNLNIRDPEESIQKVLMDGLRNEGGRMKMEEIITDKAKLIAYLKTMLERETSKMPSKEAPITEEAEQAKIEYMTSKAGGKREVGWGVEITRVAIPMLERPKEVAEAKHQRMAAKDKKEAAILIAEGEAGGIRAVKGSLKGKETVARYLGVRFIDTLKENAKYFLDFEKIPIVGKLFKEFSEKT